MLEADEIIGFYHIAFSPILESSPFSLRVIWSVRIAKLIKPLEASHHERPDIEINHRVMHLIASHHGRRSSLRAPLPLP